MSICSNRVNCRPAQLCYYDLLDAETAGSVPDDVHDHVAKCADCQSDIDRLRNLLASADKRTDSEQNRKDSAVAELLSLHFAWVDKLVTCTRVKPFLPGLADSLLRIRIPTPITVHVENCPVCFQELEALRDAALTHTQLCRMSRLLADDLDCEAESEEVRAAFPAVADMLVRPDSGVATRFTFGESSSSDSGGPQTSRPIEVEVIDRRQDAADDRQHVLIVNLKRHIGPAIAAAAVVLLGFALLFTGPAARAVGLEEVRRAIKRARNIYMTQRATGATELERERWISRPLKKYVLKVGQEWTLWDLREDSRTFKSSLDAPPEAVSFTPAELASAKSRLENPTGIRPFEYDSEVPPGAKWDKVPDAALPSGTQGCEVYDLTWTEGIDTTAVVMRKWRVFTDPLNGRPRTVEYFERLPAEAEYTPQSEYRFEYPSDAEISAIIERAFP